MREVTLIALVGRTKSGKSTLGRGLARYLRTAHVEVSDLVSVLENGLSDKEIKQSRKKTKKDPEWLGREIAVVIERKLETQGRSVIIVSGIREIEVVQYLRSNYHYYGFEVLAEMPVRYQRAITDGKYKNGDEFLRGEIRELDLGLQEVEDDAPFAVPTSPLTDPERLVKAIAKRLRHNKVNLR